MWCPALGAASRTGAAGPPAAPPRRPRRGAALRGARPGRPRASPGGGRRGRRGAGSDGEPFSPDPAAARRAPPPRSPARASLRAPWPRIDSASRMDVGLTMSTHGLLRRDERNFFLQRLEPEQMCVVELGRLADRLGYHSLWLSDHICMGRDIGAKHTANESGTRAYPERPVMLDLVATIGALAATTERVRLAPSVLIAPYRHPPTGAHQLATLDVLSGGRPIMTAGSGSD